MEKIKIYRNIAKLKDIDLFYLDTKTDGPVIICLHGRWGRGQVWADFMNKYGHKYRIIAPDQRGHGLTSKPNSKYSTEEMAQDIINLLQYLDIKRAIIVGHSMGGAIAGYLASEYADYVQAVAILDQPASQGKENDIDCTDDSMIKDSYTGNWPMPFMTLREAEIFLKDVSESELEYKYFMNSLVEKEEGYSMMFSQRAMALNELHMKKWFDKLIKIKCKTLLITKKREHDSEKYNDFLKMSEMLSDCIFYEMSNPDHNVHLANKSEFYKYFNEFLSSIN